jgi:hypothetical protein
LYLYWVYGIYCDILTQWGWITLKRAVIHLVPSTVHSYWRICQIRQSWEHGFDVTLHVLTLWVCAYIETVKVFREYLLYTSLTVRRGSTDTFKHWFSLLCLNRPRTDATIFGSNLCIISALHVTLLWHSGTKMYLCGSQKTTYIPYNISRPLFEIFVIYRRFGSTHRCHLLGPNSWDFMTLEDGTDRLSRNVANYRSTLRNIPEERRFHLQRSGSLK